MERSIVEIKSFFLYVYIYFGERWGGGGVGAYLVIHGPFGFTIVIL